MAAEQLLIVAYNFGNATEFAKIGKLIVTNGTGSLDMKRIKKNTKTGWFAADGRDLRDVLGKSLRQTRIMSGLTTSSRSYHGTKTSTVAVERRDR